MLRDGATRPELVELVRRIMDGEGSTEVEADALIDLFQASVPHPAASDLIFYPPGGRSLTPEEVVDAALDYRPIAL